MYIQKLCNLHLVVLARVYTTAQLLWLILWGLQYVDDDPYLADWLLKQERWMLVLFSFVLRYVGASQN